MTTLFTRPAACMAVLLFSARAMAQPVITSSISLPAVGTSDTLYASTSAMSPGAGGAGVTWNFSTLPLVAGGSLSVVNPASTTYASTFPTSNFCMQIVTSGTSYDYDRKSAVAMETIAATYAGTGTGNDYSPNRRMSVPFPFNYLDVKTDTFQSLGSSTNDTVRLTYDGYGTLVMPWHTYTNVIRVKEEYSATDYHYAWYTVSPFMLVLNYSHTGSAPYIYIAAIPVPSGVTEVNKGEVTATAYPNPFTLGTTIRLNIDNNELNNASLLITDMTGKVIRQSAINGKEVSVAREELAAGMYLYQVINNGARIATGKLVIQ